jgi:hypothetical protein
MENSPLFKGKSITHGTEWQENALQASGTINWVT